MLTEHKGDTYHYYTNEHDRYQGEHKWWENDGLPWEHSFFKDGEQHGEYKYWRRAGGVVTVEHAFFQQDEDITEKVKALVEDMDNITHKEKVLIKLKFGIECIKEEIKCRS